MSGAEEPLYENRRKGVSGTTVSQLQRVQVFTTTNDGFLPSRTQWTCHSSSTSTENTEA
ncbi:unnamed protein product [Ectocarpus sp. CCAP 1310/34]|nr:unnamed protein product [Ectocarpus sp. CCAP 1310/34]